MKKPSRFLEISGILKALGITLQKRLATNEFRVNFSNGGEVTACYEESLEHAYETGLAMSKEEKF
jgi:hypothetical protein